MKHRYTLALAICSLFCSIQGAQRSYSPLIKAAIENNTNDISGLLLGVSFDASYRWHAPVHILDTDEHGLTAHMYVIKNGNKVAWEVLKAQTWYSAYAHMVTDTGLTLMHYAAYYGNESVVRFLLQTAREWPQYQIPCNTQSNKGNTPKQLAQQKDHRNIVILFEAYGF